MKHLVLTITFFSFLTTQNLQAQTKEMVSKKNQIENVESSKAKTYYVLSDKQYKNLINLKDKKEITLEDGSLAYLMNFQEIARVSAISPEVLKALNEYYCSLPLEPGDLCEGNCRDCPEGYFCGYIERPSIQLYSEMFKNQKTPRIKGISKNIDDNYFVVRKPVKKCIALPSR